MKDDDPNQLDLFGTRLDYLAWRVVSKAAAKRPGRRKAATKSAIVVRLIPKRVDQKGDGAKHEREADTADCDDPHGSLTRD